MIMFANSSGTEVSTQLQQCLQSALEASERRWSEGVHEVDGLPVISVFFLPGATRSGITCLISASLSTENFTEALVHLTRML